MKRSRTGEADLVVTLYTKELGKVVAYARGVRKLNSKRRSSVEPATLCRFSLINGKNMFTLGETSLVCSYVPGDASLITLTKIQQILEIIDLLTVESESNLEVYRLFEYLLKNLRTLSKTETLEIFRQILATLGFTYDKKFTEITLKEYIEELASRPLRTKKFLHL